jgi:hypothetical protein
MIQVRKPCACHVQQCLHHAAFMGVTMGLNKQGTRLPQLQVFVTLHRETEMPIVTDINATRASPESAWISESQTSSEPRPTWPLGNQT